jgi:hypothetical protein
LKLPPNIKNYQIKGTERNLQTADKILTQWPILLNKPENTIFISRNRYAPLLQQYFIGYRKIALFTQPSGLFGKKQGEDAPIAFIPLR